LFYFTFLYFSIKTSSFYLDSQVYHISVAHLLVPTITFILPEFPPGLTAVFSICLSSRTASLCLLLQQVCMFLLCPWLGKFHFFPSLPLCLRLRVMWLTAQCTFSWWPTMRIIRNLYSTDTFSKTQLCYILVWILFITRLFTSVSFPGRGKTSCIFSQQTCVMCLIFEIVTNRRQCLESFRI
jgi:hypothetical protein